MDGDTQPINRVTNMKALSILSLSLIVVLSGCTTTGSDYRSLRSTEAVNEALRDFSLHAAQRPTCAWYPSTMAMHCN